MIKKSELLSNIEANSQTPVVTANGSIHPDTLCPFGPTLVDGGSASIYSNGRAVLKTFSEELQKMAVANEAVRFPHAGAKQELMPGGGGTRYSIDPSKVQEFSKGLDASFSRAGQAMDKARAGIVAGVDAMSAEVAAKLRDPQANNISRAQEGSETRAIIRAMAPAERMGAVAALIKDGDIASVSAVLHASPITTGIPAASISTLRQLAEQKFAGDVATRRDAAIKVLNTVDQAAQGFIGKFKGYVPNASAASNVAATTALEALRTGKAA